MSTHHRSVARGLPCLALAALLQAGPAAAESRPEVPPAEVKAPPLRVQVSGHSPVKDLRDQAEMLQGLCRLQLKLPPSTADLPSDKALARVASVDTEELFDGPLYAQYQTARNLLADDTDGCKIKIYQRFTVEIEKSCDRRLSGIAGGFGPDGDPPTLTEDVYRPSPALRRFAPCSERATTRPGILDALKKTSRQPAGLGVQCLWSNETAVHLAAAVGVVSAPDEDPHSGSCVYAELPDYPYTTYQGHNRSVSVQSRMPRRSGDRYRATGMAFGILNQNLKDFSIGTPIPASRFSRAAAEAFLGQPAVVPLTEPSD